MSTQELLNHIHFAKGKGSTGVQINGEDGTKNNNNKPKPPDPSTYENEAFKKKHKTIGQGK